MTLHRKKRARNVGGGALDDGEDALEDVLRFTFGTTDEDDTAVDAAMTMPIEDLVVGEDVGPVGRNEHGHDIQLQLFAERAEQLDAVDVYVGAFEHIPPALFDATMIAVTNNVVQARLCQPIDWRFIVPRCGAFGFKFSTKKFGAIDMACLAPKVTLRGYSGGKVSCSGARDMDQAVFCIQSMLDILRSLRDHYNIRIYESLHCVSVALVNVVGDIDLGFGVDLNRLSQFAFVKYDPEEWPTAAVRMRELAPETYGKRKVTALISDEGKIVFSGCRDRRELARVFHDILPLVISCCAQSVAPVTTTGDEQRRAAIKRTRVHSLPPLSQAVVKLVYVGAVAATASTALVVRDEPLALAPLLHPKRRGVPTGNELARNLIALDSMDKQKAAAARALRAELDAEINNNNNAVSSSSTRTNVLSASESKLLAMLHD